MSDNFSKLQRSQIMSRVRSRKNKSTELRLISFFKENKITGWRRGYALFGKPDFVFPKKKIAIFADGCFWHGHDCRNLSPASNKVYWQTKILRNKERDRLVSKILKERGWKVVRIWECEITKKSSRSLALDKMLLILKILKNYNINIINP